MRLESYRLPAPGKGEVLVRVKAASINPLGWKLRQGFMKIIMGGRSPRGMGSDFSGVVEVIGPGVIRFALGDEVLGTAPMKASGCFAEAVITTSNLLIMLNYNQPLPEDLEDLRHRIRLPWAPDREGRGLPDETIRCRGGYRSDLRQFSQVDHLIETSLR